uniref:Rho-GAP domain-containing protein n=1 Tax=Strix occidentalis caurina TaxID=311401 RepID=A0A8D0G0U7_STROC
WKEKKKGERNPTSLPTCFCDFRVSYCHVSMIPYVLKSCAEFIETHGIVDGIYRLSGVTSNIQKLR